MPKKFNSSFLTSEKYKPTGASAPSVIYKRAFEEFQRELEETGESTNSKDEGKFEFSDFSRLFHHMHNLKHQNPNTKEETWELTPPQTKVTDAGPVTKKIKYWRLDDVTSEHWNQSLGSSERTLQSLMHKNVYNFENCDPDFNKELSSVSIPSPGCLPLQHLNDFVHWEHIKAVGDVNKCGSSITEAIHKMYKLADTLELDKDSEEAEVMTAALEAMGCANYLTKRTQGVVESEMLRDPLLRRYSAYSWESLPSAVLDVEQLQLAKEVLDDNNPNRSEITEDLFEAHNKTSKWRSQD